MQGLQKLLLKIFKMKSKRIATENRNTKKKKKKKRKYQQKKRLEVSIS